MADDPNKTDDPNYLSLKAEGVASGEARGKLSVFLLAVVFALVVALIVWGLQGPGGSLILLPLWLPRR